MSLRLARSPLQLLAKLLRRGSVTAATASPLQLGHADASRGALHLGGGHGCGFRAQIASLQQGGGAGAGLLGASLVNVGRTLGVVGQDGDDVGVDLQKPATDEDTLIDIIPADTQLANIQRGQ